MEAGAGAKAGSWDRPAINQKEAGPRGREHTRGPSGRLLAAAKSNRGRGIGAATDRSVRGPGWIGHGAQAD